MGGRSRRRRGASRPDRREPRSRVGFTLEPAGAAVKLTVVHDGFAPGSTVRDMIGEGWPALLSSLKTLLETGEPLPS
ncbi:SRPBCC domain-containing protein [Glycomyces terrestris]|uniref:SRPBCC domain-containing protein n=1 Tax=Glycomyces terrestris TaxID=2493553 RepID=UPI0038CC1825